MKALTLVPFLIGFALPAMAIDATEGSKSYLHDHIAKWAQDPVLIDAIKAQNAANASINQAAIDALDLQWRAEVGKKDSALINGVMNNPAAAFLASQVQEAGGVITEAFIMDNHGLNVAASNTTSDYWQGDEDKFTKTYPMGADAVHIGDVEFDDSSQSYQVQISIPMVDPADGQVIGAMTVALNAESL
jgi:hypothetical protein